MSIATNVEIDLVKYGNLVDWIPKLGDMIFKDGLIVRWCAVIDGMMNDDMNIRKAGNPQLLFAGEYKNEVLNSRKIKSARFGTYYICSDGTYYV